MALILCIETTSTNCSVAIASEEGGFANKFGIKNCIDLIEDKSDSYSHGELLHVYIKEVLERNGFNTQNLDAIAISKGPGSYTGLRIGVASAKGLCYALDIPLISIDTLAALSLHASQEKTIISMVDARRMEVYSSVFKNGNIMEAVTATVLTEDSFTAYLEKGNVSVVGTGAPKFQELNNDDKNEYTNVLPTALTMCDLALNAYKKSDTVKDIAYFEPFYLKEFRTN
jgi:tRNA threonylcarbamoyladenosine biosynthesis protein TsaB